MPNKFKSILFVTIQAVCSVVIMVTGPVNVAGVVNWVLLAGGGVLAVWAFALNKPRWGLIFPEPPPEMKLITSGPYRFIRHPMYASLLLVTVSWLRNDFSWVRLFVWAILLGNMLLKIVYEEGLLIARFPEYADYRKKTKRLIPFLLGL